MMNAAPYTYPTNTDDPRASALTGARLLMMERCFDALIDEMISDGAEPVNAAVSMLDFLAERFAARARSEAVPSSTIDLADFAQMPS
jgi:hypothetical protein